MSLPVNIDDLINARTVESVRVEFKRGWNPEEVLHTVCAYSNDIKEYGGGYIIVGIEVVDGAPQLPPIGINQNQIDKIQQEFVEQVCFKIKENVHPLIEPIIYQGQWIIVIWVVTGEERPYDAPSTLGKNPQRKVYIRDGSITRPASNREVDELRELSRYRHFDDRINQQAEINDLDLGLIQSYLQEIKSELYNESLKLPIEELAIKMQIARGPSENIKPLNVGLLMFCKEPHKFFEGCKTNLVEFEDQTGARYSEKIFVGPVHTQIREIMVYISTNIIKQFVMKSATRPESDVFFNYPYQALEEAVVNAIYHRSYEDDRPNEIRIYKSAKAGTGGEDYRKIEIRSYPGPLPPIDQQALLQQRFTSRNYRNIKLGDWLKNIRLTEKYATGIPTVFQALDKNESPEPIFWTDDAKSEFLVVIKAHESTPYYGDKDATEIESIILSNVQQQILEMIKNEPKSLVHVKRAISVDISREISFLHSKGLLGIKRVVFSRILFITNKGQESLKSSF